MLIIGAKGFAKEVLEVLHQSNKLNELVFYDDVNLDMPEKLFGKYPILKTPQEASDYFKSIDPHFSIGIGNPIFRKKLFDKFMSLGGKYTSTISNKATIGSYEVKIGDGCNILNNAIFSNNVSVGKGCIVYYNVILTHDCKVKDFVALSPGATLLGSCTIGSFSQIGANTTILPKIKIGENVTIGAGAVVTKNMPDNCVAVGAPAKIIRNLDPLHFEV